MKSGLRFIFIVCLLSVVCGCQTYEPPPPPPPPQISEPPAKVFQPVAEDSQLPEEKLKAASERYDGALNSPSMSPGSAVQSKSEPISHYNQNGRLVLVLGPVVNENSTSQKSNVGQSLREAIAHELTSTRDIQLIDAPEERYKNDSPRPDLARRGIRYVVKGVASFSPKSGQTTVFLRAVNTGNGEVEAVASGRNAEENRAAGDAARRLKKKLED